MSFDLAGIAAAVGQGAAHGFGVHKQEVKEKEQQTYDRGRQAVQDQQAATLHGQTVKQNDFTLESNARAQAEAKRKELLNEKLGTYQVFDTTGDIDGAAKTYVEFANQDNVGNPKFDQNHALSYVKNDDGTVNLNIVDKNTGALVRVAKEKASIRDFVAATYQQLDPTKSYETKIDNEAKSALKSQEYNWEERKLGLQNSYDLIKENNKFGNDVRLEGVKHENNFSLEQFRQGGANYRAELGQEGANYRAEVGQEGANYRASIGGKGSSTTKASSAVVSGVQGAIGFAQQNAPMLGFLSNNPRLSNLTIAMMGIESGGRARTSYDGSSHGVMQINAKYAQGFARQFGIQGNPITDQRANIQTGAALIGHLDKKYNGDTTLVAAAYNAGEPAVDSAVARWKASGGKGSWFDHLNIKPEAREQVYGHIVKFNQALGYLDGHAQPTNMTMDQQDQKYAQNTVNAKEDYRKGISATAQAAINSTATNMAKELGITGGASASILGGLGATQTEIAKFASSNTRNERVQAYQNIYRQVHAAVSQTEAGAMMTPAALKGYVKQKSAELVGATNETEVGVWIRNGKDGAKPAAPKPQSNIKSGEIDNILYGTSASDNKPAAKAAPAANKAAIPYKTVAQREGVQAVTSMKPASVSAKPAAKPAPKAAAKPVSQAEKNAQARAERKQKEADAINAKHKQKKEDERKAEIAKKEKAKENFAKSPFQVKVNGFQPHVGATDVWKKNLNR